MKLLKLLSIGTLVAFVSPVHAQIADITLEELGNRVNNNMNSLNTANQDLQDVRFYIDAPSLDETVQRGNQLPASVNDSQSYFQQGMEGEVSHGLGYGNGILSQSNYMDSYGNDQNAVNLGALLGQNRISGNEEDSMVRLIRNVTIPFPSRGGSGGASEEDIEQLRQQAEDMGLPFSAEDFGSSEDATMKLMAQALASASQTSLMHMLAIRQGNPSLMDTMQQESMYRLDSQDWHDGVAVASTEALLRELLYIESYRVWQAQQLYLQNERIEALLAVMNSSMTKMAGMADMAGSEMQKAQKYKPDVSTGITLQ